MCRYCESLLAINIRPSRFIITSCPSSLSTYPRSAENSDHDPLAFPSTQTLGSANRRTHEHQQPAHRREEEHRVLTTATPYKSEQKPPSGIPLPPGSRERQAGQPPVSGCAEDRAACEAHPKGLGAVRPATADQLPAWPWCRGEW